MLPRALDLSKAVPVDVNDAELTRIRRGYALANALSLDSLVDGVKAVGAEEVVPLQKNLWQRYSSVSFDRDSNGSGVKLLDLESTAEELAAWFDEALDSHPEVAPELRMLKSIYRHHGAVFRGGGGKDPLELLFRSNQHSETAGVYSESFYARYYNMVVAHAFSTFAKAWLADRDRDLEHGVHRLPHPLRVLEVGAGSGSTSRKLLQTAATLGISVDFHFTDISETFLRKASGDKATTVVPGASVTFKHFNAETDPRTQGFASSTFDVVVGVNVIHATNNLYETMTHVRQLLRPRGIVILSEIVQPGPISDATFGMTEGWWRFEDTDLRPDYPLMDTANWDRLLHATDFDRARILENAKAGTAQAVMVGEAASWPATRAPIALPIGPVEIQAGRSVYLVTGGTGGLGLLTAIVLLEQKHCDKVYLLSRSGKVLPPNSAHVRGRLEAVAGPDQVEKVQCDVSSASQVAEVLDSISQKGEHVKGIVRSSGVLRDAMPQNQTRTTLTPVFGAKAEALRHLHDLSLDLPHLRHFIIFSSASALLGSPGQGNHSLANAFLDAFAANRRAQGLPALCLQWGTVMGLGEAARKGAIKLALKSGHGQLSETAAVAVLKAVFASNPHFTRIHSVAVSPFDWNTFTKSRTKVPHITRSFTSSISAKLRTPTIPNASSKPSGIADTAGTSKENSSTALTEITRRCVEATINHRISDESTTFHDAGVDSLSAIEFRNRLQSKLGNKAKLGASLVFDCPNVKRLRSYLESVLEPEDHVNDMRAASDPEPNAANSSTEHNSANSSSIDVAQDRAVRSAQPKPTITVIRGAAHTTEDKVDNKTSIVGMGCRLPTAGNTDELWHSLLTGKDGFRDIPFSRWDLDDKFYTRKSENGASRSYVKQGVFLTPEHLDWFDNKFFNISEAEARSMEPNQRLGLKVSYQALADAGYTRRALRGQNIGLFVGFMNYDQFFLANKGLAGAFTASSASPAALSNRVSHVLGLEGPSCTIDTACSSSLYALHMAIAALRSHQCDAAVVAGLNVMMSPAAFVAECAAGMLSATERCHDLCASADGFARGEGCAAIVIQRCADADSQNRRVYANILGTAVGHDGTKANLTSPNGPAQSRIIRRALADAGASPKTISFVEGHFTGTVLGDPIEFHTLNEVFAGKDAGQGRAKALYLGDLKSNLGHLEGVAGVAGLIKAVLALAHKQLPPIAH